MNHSADLVALAEVLQAPVATSIAGKGAMPENHPLAVGWGYGPQGTVAAEMAFKNVDLVLALGVKFSEVSTGYYSLPRHRHLIHVDINSDNLGRIMPTSVCVHADMGVFLGQALASARVCGAPATFAWWMTSAAPKAQRGRLPRSDQFPMRRRSNGVFNGGGMRAPCDALTFVDVTVSQYWAAEVFSATQPRTFFNPTNNQAMGWSIPAAARRPACVSQSPNDHGNRRRLLFNVRRRNVNRRS